MIIQPQILTTQSEAPSPGDGDFRVRFFNYNGTIISTQYVDAGNDAVEPTVPTNPDLTLTGWNNSFANVQGPVDVGAEYTTADGKTHAHIMLTTVSGLDLALYLTKDDTSTLTIDWGDTTSDDYSTAGDISPTHTYSTTGTYVVRIWISSGAGAYTLGSGTTAFVFCGGGVQVIRSMLVRLHIAAGASIAASAFNYCNSLMSLSIPTGTELASYMCQRCYSLQHLTVPSGLTSLPIYVAEYCYSLFGIIFPSTLTTTTGTAVRYCYNLRSVIMYQNVISIGTGSFGSCSAIKEYILNPATPPTLASTNVFIGISTTCKIYVPDASLAAYKSATNWSTYADYIYNLSEWAE